MNNQQLSSISHNIKHRKKSNDVFYTPEELAKECIKLCDIKDGQTVLDSAAGQFVFFNNFPDNCYRDWCEISINPDYDFFKKTEQFDWIITNPPYSILDEWFKKTCQLSKIGFGLLIGWNNLTAKRIEMCNSYGFGLSQVHMFKVFKWFGMSCFVVFEKYKGNIITYNRKVWR